MLVYRIEGENGDGIYRGKYCRDNPMDWIPSKHPGPARDSLLVDNANVIRQNDDADFVCLDFCDWIMMSKYIFGFASTEQLRNWIFNDMWLWRMEERGFRLAVFDIDPDDVIVGHTQCIFHREKIRQASYFKPAEFFGIEEEPEDWLTVSHTEETYNDDE